MFPKHVQMVMLSAIHLLSGVRIDIVMMLKGMVSIIIRMMCTFIYYLYKCE